ncbi:50S ribosomal protein L5 [candidate division WWE3 bacterium]|nr:50S ribosomal protein L5 [candidate division WWE3 bacterium]
MTSRLKQKYEKEIVPELVKELGVKTVMSVPKIKKIVINSGVGRFRDDKGLLESTVRDVGQISGQKPTFRSAKKSISNFKVRQGDVVGVTVTLRGERMWTFLDKLFSIVLPRVRDFKGLRRSSFDGSGNFTIGLKEHTVFPEINPNTVDKIKNLEVTIVTSAKNNEEAFKLLSKLDAPFEK